MNKIVSDEESIVRLISKEWLQEGKLLHVAFSLRADEAYLSVNRPNIGSFDTDVASFVKNHNSFAFGDDTLQYCGATMNVGEVRSINAQIKERIINIEVDVEPRDTNIKSHAGIFTRYNNRNLKVNHTPKLLEEGVSVDDVFLKVRFQLLRMSSLAFHGLATPKTLRTN